MEITLMNITPEQEQQLTNLAPGLVNSGFFALLEVLEARKTTLVTDIPTRQVLGSVMLDGCRDFEILLTDYPQTLEIPKFCIVSYKLM